MPEEAKEECKHCWHKHYGSYMAVLKDGHVLMSCCKCGAIKQVHQDHILDDKLGGH